MYHTGITSLIQCVEFENKDTTVMQNGNSIYRN